jgi:hypothetical protein
MTSASTKAALNSTQCYSPVAAASDGLRDAMAAEAARTEAFTTASTIDRALARCALLPLWTLLNLRERSCTDAHDSVGLQ